MSSATRSWLFSALTAAESSSLATSRAALRVEKRSSERASSICLPRTWSATRRSLRGATRTYLALARTTGGATGAAGAFFAAAFFAAGFLAAAFFAGAFFAAGFLAASFFAASFFADGFFAAGFFLGVSSAIAYSSDFEVPEWARKVRVGANSPSLWPTIYSEM